MIINLTQHPIKFFKDGDTVYNQALRKNVLKNANIKPVKIIPSYGMVSVRTDTKIVDYIDGVPVFEKVPIHIDPLPEIKTNEEIIYIVSGAYAKEYVKRNIRTKKKLYVIADQVYMPDGRTIIGSKGIIKF